MVEFVERTHWLDGEAVMGDHVDAQSRHRLADFADPQFEQRGHRARVLSGLQRREHPQFGNLERVDIDLDFR